MLDSLHSPEPMLPMLMYDSEPALHHSCCHSSKQDGSVFFVHVAWMSDLQDMFTALHTSIRGLLKDWRRSAAQYVHVTSGYGPWKQTFIHSTTDSTQHGDLTRIEDDGGNSWKWLRSSQGLACDDDDDICIASIFGLEYM